MPRHFKRKINRLQNFYLPRLFECVRNFVVAIAHLETALEINKKALDKNENHLGSTAIADLIAEAKQIRRKAKGIFQKTLTPSLQSRLQREFDDFQSKIKEYTSSISLMQKKFVIHRAQDLEREQKRRDLTLLFLSLEEGFSELKVLGSGPFKFGQKKMGDQEWDKLNQELESRSKISRLKAPKFFPFKRIKSQALLQTTEKLCESMKDVIGWKYHQTKETGDDLVMRQIRNLYADLAYFQKYIQSDPKDVKRTYLSQAKDFSEKLTQFYDEYLSVQDQVFLRDSFRTFLQQLEKVHKKFGSKPSKA